MGRLATMTIVATAVAGLLFLSPARAQDDRGRVAGFSVDFRWDRAVLDPAYKNTGCQWRMLPKDFPPYNTVFYYFNKWKLEGVFEELMDTLHRMVRKLMGGRRHPASASLIPEASSPPTMLTPTMGSTATRRSRGARNTLWLTHLVFL